MSVDGAGYSAVAIHAGVGFCAGLFIYLIYRLTFNGVIFTKSFGTALIMLTMVTTMVILPIATNLIVALGWWARVSIVRLGPAVKDPLDTNIHVLGDSRQASRSARGFIPGAAGFGMIGVALLLWNLFRSKKNFVYVCDSL